LTFIARIVQDMFINIDPCLLCVFVQLNPVSLIFSLRKIHGLQYKLMRDAP